MGGEPVMEQRFGVVVDPAVPDDDAKVLREGRATLVRMRTGWVPEPSGRRPGAKAWMFLIRAATIGVGAVVFLGALRVSGSFLAFMFFGAVVIAAMSLGSKADDGEHDPDE